MPAKVGVHPLLEVFFHAMSAHVPSMKSVGCKWIECYPNNPKKFGIPQTTGLLVLNNVLSGCPIAVMDCTWITAMCTPAVTVLAAKALHPNAETFGMFGYGFQGIEHVRYAVKTLKNLLLMSNFESLIQAVVKGNEPDVVAGVNRFSYGYLLNWTFFME